MLERKPSKTFKQLETEAQEVDAVLNRLNTSTAIFEKSRTQVALEVGAILTAAQKKLSKYGEGTYIRWIQERLGMKKTTAYKWIRLHEFFGDCPPCVQSIDVSALYILAKDSGPVYRSALKDALELADKGVRVTCKHVRLILQAHRDEALQRICQAHREEPDPDKWDDEDVPEVPGRRTPLQKLKGDWRAATLDEQRQFKKWVKDKARAQEERRQRREERSQRREAKAGN